MKALALFSGGLDSLLSIKIIQQQGVEVIGLFFNTGFAGTNDRERDNYLNKAIKQVDAKLEMISAGLQLGYQFVIKDRFTIDMVLMGPSYSYYIANIGLDAEVELDKNSDFYKDLQDYLEKITPGLSSILEKQELSSTGKLNFSYYGFRYLVQFGYRF